MCRLRFWSSGSKAFTGTGLETLLWASDLNACVSIEATHLAEGLSYSISRRKSGRDIFRFHQAQNVDERGQSFGQRGGNSGLHHLGSLLSDLKFLRPRPSPDFLNLAMAERKTTTCPSSFCWFCSDSSRKV